MVPYTATGTQDGEIPGVEATGTEIEVQDVFIHRVEDGRLVEEADLWDAFGLLHQIGAVSMPFGD